MNRDEFRNALRGLIDDAFKSGLDIERLWATQERMWCKSCGTVTRTQECDCTRMETGTQRLVNYADSLQNDIESLRATEARLRAALKTVQVGVSEIWNSSSVKGSDHGGSISMTKRARLWAIFRDGKVLIAHASRRNARDQIDAYKLDGHSKHKWTLAAILITHGEGKNDD